MHSLSEDKRWDTIKEVPVRFYSFGLHVQVVDAASAALLWSGELTGKSSQLVPQQVSASLSTGTALYVHWAYKGGKEAAGLPRDNKAARYVRKTAQSAATEAVKALLADVARSSAVVVQNMEPRGAVEDVRQAMVRELLERELINAGARVLSRDAGRVEVLAHHAATDRFGYWLHPLPETPTDVDKLVVSPDISAWISAKAAAKSPEYCQGLIGDAGCLALMYRPAFPTARWVLGYRVIEIGLRPLAGDPEERSEVIFRVDLRLVDTQSVNAVRSRNVVERKIVKYQPERKKAVKSGKKYR